MYGSIHIYVLSILWFRSSVRCLRLVPKTGVRASRGEVKTSSWCCRCIGALRPSGVVSTPVPRRGAERVRSTRERSPCSHCDRVHFSQSLFARRACTIASVQRVLPTLVFRDTWPIYLSAYRAIIIAVVASHNSLHFRRKNLLLASRYSEEIYIVSNTWTAKHEGWSRHRRDAFFC